MNETSIPTLIPDYLIGSSGAVLGSGIDYLTTEIKESAIQSLSLSTVAQTANYTLNMISSSSDLDKLIEIDLGASYEFDDFGVEGQLKYVSQIKFSALSFSVVVRINFEDASYPSNTSPFALTAEAANTLKLGSTQFRSIYGDYFVSSIRCISSFQIVYNFSSTCVDKLQNFRSSISSNYGFFSGNMTTQVQTEIQENDISFQISSTAFGYTGHLDFPTEFQDIAPFIDSFDINKQGVPYYLQLTHYSLVPGVNSNFPAVVPVSQDELNLFNELKRNLVILIGSFNSDFPSYYMNELIANGIQDFFTNINQFISSVPGDNDMPQITQFLTQIDDFQSQVDGVLNCQLLYELVSANFDTNKPSLNTEYSSGFNLGVISSTDPNILSNFPPDITDLNQIIPITSQSISVYEHWRIGHRSADVDQIDPNTIVIGYSLANSEGYGYVEVKSDGVLTSELSFHFRSDYDRGIEWTLNYLTVPKEFFYFDENAKKNPKSLSLNFKDKFSSDSLTLGSQINLAQGENLYKINSLIFNSLISKDIKLSASLYFWYKLDLRLKTLEVCANNIICEDSPFVIIENETTGLRSKIYLYELIGNKKLALEIDENSIKYLLSLYDSFLESTKTSDFIHILRTQINLDTMSEKEILSLSTVHKDGVFLEFFDSSKTYDASHEITPIQSQFYGVVTLSSGEKFINVQGSDSDPKVNSQSWMTLWWQNVGNVYPAEGGVNTHVCTSLDSSNGGSFTCTVDGSNNGGHVVSTAYSPVVKKGANYVWIFPICAAHNNPYYTGQMSAVKHFIGVALHNYLG